MGLNTDILNLIDERIDKHSYLNEMSKNFENKILKKIARDAERARIRELPCAVAYGTSQQQLFSFSIEFRHIVQRTTGKFSYKEPVSVMSRPSPARPDHDAT